MRQWLLAISANIVGTAIVLALIIIGLTINNALAEEQTAALNVTVTVAEPPIWIEADDASEITITTEHAMAYCYAHGLEMHECRIVPAELVEWENNQ